MKGLIAKTLTHIRPVPIGIMEWESAHLTPIWRELCESRCRSQLLWHADRQPSCSAQAQIPSYNSAPTPGVRDGSAAGGMRWMGSARGAHNVGGIADSSLVTSVSALTNTMVRILLQKSHLSGIASLCPSGCNAQLRWR